MSSDCRQTSARLDYRVILLTLCVSSDCRQTSAGLDTVILLTLCVSSDCRQTSVGLDYRGKVAVTDDNRNCKVWTNVR